MYKLPTQIVSGVTISYHTIISQTWIGANLDINKVINMSIKYKGVRTRYTLIVFTYCDC